ncbi:MAG: NAD-binding protein [Planctomycetes bacterium]|nr:NAD-binding protein [Planctomycetota bacterium]
MSHNPGEPAEPTTAQPARPIIVCGLGRVGQNLAQYLVSLGAKVVCIDTEAPADSLRADGVQIISGDCRDDAALRRAGIDQASALVAVTSDDQSNLKAALAARAMRDDLRLVVRLHNEVLMERLGTAIPNLQALSTSRLAAPMIAAEALKGGEADRVSLGGFSTSLDDQHPWELAQVVVPRNSQLVGLKPSEVPGKLEIVVAGASRDPSPLRLVEPSEPEDPIRPGDSLLVAGSPTKLRASLLAGHTLADEFRWATWSRRAYHAARLAFPYDLSVPVASIMLVLVLLASTILFSTALEKSLADAMFRTVSIIATGADMHEGDYHQKPWLKVFVSVLRIAGAALLALFTALLTNYFVKARLGEALLVTRVPDSGHVVVCGLGKVGFELAKLLKNAGMPTAVIEVEGQSPYILPLKRMGIPVINGDGGNAIVLGQASAAGARAVIAVTSSDLVNLQIALVAKSMGDPKKAVVLLQADESFASRLREEVDLNSALSIPELTAPAIAAAVFGDRVHALFRVGRNVHAVVSRQVDGPSPSTWTMLLGHHACQKIVPLFVIDKDGQRHLPGRGDFPAGANRLVGIEKLESMRERAGQHTMAMTSSKAFPAP